MRGAALIATFDPAASAAIAAPAEGIWRLLCDTRRYSEWVEGTEAVTRTDGEASAGCTYAEINPNIGAWKVKAEWTVIEFDAPHRQVHRSEDIPMAAEFSLAASAQRSLLSPLTVWRLA